MTKKIFYIISLSISLHAAAYNLSDYETLKMTNKCEGCNLSNVDLSSLTLKNIDLTASNLANAKFSNTNVLNVLASIQCHSQQILLGTLKNDHQPSFLPQLNQKPGNTTAQSATSFAFLKSKTLNQ